MRISLNWLQELVDISLSAANLADRLTMAGFEVEDIEDRRTWAEGVVIGRVLERAPHPNADKLSVCQVDIGTPQPVQIVCGAANVRADIWVAVATIGAYLPKIDLKIKAAKLRGEASSGMICSLAEVGLTKDAEGIHIFDESIVGPLTAGMDARSALGLEDVVLDLSSTANRADALSLVGIAREIAAFTGVKLKKPQPVAIEAPVKADLNLNISDPQACPAYFATQITGITVGPSPLWLQRRLSSSGVRPINNVVDVTNYIMLEWGQPLHAFDYDRLMTLAGDSALTSGLTLGVRFAEAGETIQTLDAQTRTAQTQTLFITANDQPVALAGLMGGADSEVVAETQTLLLEAAIFDTAVIRRSGRAQGLRTEASARYERGVNLAELELALDRAVQLLIELAGGTVVAGARADARPEVLSRSVELRLARVNQVLGPVLKDEEPVELTAADVERTLGALNCQLTSTGDGVWTVLVPPYRYRDLEREIDLIEEVARLYGYNEFCEQLPAQAEQGELSIEQIIQRKMRASLRGAGLTELIHYSLVKPGGSRQVMLSNPLLAEYSALRTDLIDGLIEACQFNLEQGNGILNGFEIGSIFFQDEEGYAELLHLSGILGGDTSQGRWIRGGKEQALTWHEAKGVLDSLFDSLGMAVEYQPDRRDERLHPGRTASIWLRGTRLGTLGELHPQLTQARGLSDGIYVFELDLEVVFDELSSDEMLVTTFEPYSTYPSSDRDMAFYVKTDTSVAQIEHAIRKVGGKLLQQISLFDEYRGDRVPAGQRSLAFRLVYQAIDRTLTDEDIDPIQQTVRETLVDKFQVDLRS